MMSKRDPFHEGEQFVQERAGERAAALRNAPILGDAIPSRAIPFLAQQRMLAVGSVDEQGAPSASVLFGERGFVSSPDGRRVLMDRRRIDMVGEDPLWSSLRADANVGLLAIELGTRRRLRVNGIVSRIDDAQIEVVVREAYPNCPKYIQRRHVREDSGPPFPGLPTVRGVWLDRVRSDLIARADTLFVASQHAVRGVDVSHRGGEPGFVRVLDSNRLRIPDYAGNSMFNTLGNFVADDRAGLVFLDFERGRLLQLSGTVAVRFDQAEDPRQPTGGTGRYWDFQVARWLELPIAKFIKWELLDRSPFNPGAMV